MNLTRSNTGVLYRYLDLEGSLEAAGKESSKRPHDGGEAGEGDAVDLEGIEPHGGLRRQEGSVRQEESSFYIRTSSQRNKTTERRQLKHPFHQGHMVTSNVKPHPSGERLQDAGQGVILQLEKLRRLAVHLEAVGVVVEFHRTDEVAAAGHHVGELRRD